MMRSLLQRLRHRSEGMAAVEFAFAAPILITMYLGGYQLMDAVSVYRKVTSTTRTIADLTSQFTSVTDSDLDEVLAASEQIMRPYASSGGSYRVSLITVDAAGSAKVTWSRGLSTAPLNAGSSYNLPLTLKNPGMVYVVSDVTYQYTPIAGGNILGSIPLGDQIYMMPRGSVTIVRKT